MNLRPAVLLVILMGALLAPAPARAQDAQLAKAQTAFNQAQDAYAAADYDKAATLFEDAYTARPFPLFLFNIGAAYHAKGIKANDPAAFTKAVDYYDKFLAEKTGISAHDRTDAQAARDDAKKRADALAAPPSPDAPSAPPDTTGKVPSIRGLVVVESDPQSAYIYLDSKKTEPLGRTPWSGSLEGDHTVYVERQGYKPMEKQVAPDPSKLLVIYFGMSEEDYLGWLEITSNIPGASIYFDDKSVGIAGKTPFSGNVKPGKKKVWVTAEGYDEYATEIEVVPGKTYNIEAKLSGTPVGYLSIRGGNFEKSQVYVDGQLLCEIAPCRKAVAEGTHTVSVRRTGYKSYTRKIDVQAKTEITVRPQLAKTPGRGDAIVAGIFSVTFLAGGTYAFLQYRDYDQQIQDAEDAGMPVPDGDSRRDKRQYFGIGAAVGGALGVVTGITAIYYAFRDKGAPSTGTVDIRAVALDPTVGPDFAGLRLGFAW